MAPRITIGGFDVRLKAKDSGSAISVHKIVLFARSEVFKLLLEPDEIKPSVHLETITLSDMKHNELEAFVDFIYSDIGSVLSKKAKKHVRSLYVAADKYMIPDLRDLCRNELIYSLNPSNALDILKLAEIPFDNALSAAAFTTVIPNMRTFAYSNECKLLAWENPNLAVEIAITYLNRPRPKNSLARSIGNRIYAHCHRSSLEANKEAAWAIIYRGK